MAKKHDINRIDRTLLHPWLNYKLTLFLNKCAKKGYYLIVTEGFRTKERQNELYAQGRTKPGIIVTNARGKDEDSQHQWAIAFDICMNYDVDGDGKVTDDTWNSKGFKEVAKIAKSVGLGWGGDWTSPVDMPHLYLKKWGSTPKKLKAKYGTFAKFKKTFTKTVTGAGKKGIRLFENKKRNKVRKWIKNGTKVNVMYTKLWYAKIEIAGEVGLVRKKYLK